MPRGNIISMQSHYAKSNSNRNNNGMFIWTQKSLKIITWAFLLSWQCCRIECKIRRKKRDVKCLTTVFCRPFSSNPQTMYH